MDVTFLKDDVERRYRAYLDPTGIVRLAEAGMPVLCLFGMNIHFLAREPQWMGFAISPDGEDRFLSRAVVQTTMRAMIPGALQFYTDLVAMGLDVYSALPPRRTSTALNNSLPPIFRGLKDILVEETGRRGVHVLDHRGGSLNDEGHLKTEYAHPDPNDGVHTSEAFGRTLLAQWAEVRAPRWAAAE